MLVAGYGGGKSHAGTLKTIAKKLEYPQYKVAYYLPTYGLIRDIAFDKFPDILSELGLYYKLNKTDKEIHINNFGTIIFRSMDTPETIVGYETAYSLIDEADIMPMDKMDKVYKKILGRNRAVPNATIDAVSTPEGFKWLYNAAISGFFKVIKAKSTDNKFLSDDYIQTLIDQYPKELLEAYMNGEFTNLTSGTVYKFDRIIHNTDREANEYESLIIGQDFNVGGCISIVYVQDGMGIYAVDEIESKDTFQVIENIKNRYPNREIEIIPDASGRAGKTNASQSDIQMLVNAGFYVNAPKNNPRVQDRVNATNKMFEERRLFVNVNKCPKFANALEQQSFKNGEPEKFNGAGTIDDYNDAGTYPIVRLFGLNKPDIGMIKMKTNH